ncbi:hypothetical protein MUY35_06830 [Aliiroseovarius sp. S1339]|uniref:hypothetical protein n=1 Tax=Aliiroseovarius sp. S1339 TaxID=2936990 RepID=UPI0020BD4F70|nr:hypothetical protein [Aliiroseovarius sp. S1339]MCK8463562.1 hypothetical protein [Aliiroseovarius sp. S1339]
MPLRRRQKRVACLAGAVLCVLGGLVPAAHAQSAQGTRPLSAIDWLSDSIALPPPSADSAILPPALNEPATSTGASVAEVTMTLLETPVLDAVGLLPHIVTGLPRNLWGMSRPDDLARRISALELDLLPAMQNFLLRLMLAELDPPKGSSAAEDRLFLARVDRLLSLGALDQAEALLARAGSVNPRVFRRAFDTALLLGNEDQQCTTLRATPDLSPTFTARVFCLARSGDWDAAVLTLETGRALGYISDEDDALLARFLDPDLFEDEPELQRPDHPSPLTFRMFEAIGLHINTSSLPLAFAQSDLRANIGWKARAEAGERLARVGAVTENQLLGLYSERKPAASGGIWDRMSAVKAVEQALASGDDAKLARTVEDLWAHLEASGLEVVFAQIFGSDIAARNLPGTAGDIGLRLGLLSEQYETVAEAASADPDDPLTNLLLGIARGQTEELTPMDDRTRAVLEGFTANSLPVRLHSLVEQDRLGEAILRAVALFTSGSNGDLDELTDALAFFRQVGLEQVARQAAIEFLILERRG